MEKIGVFVLAVVGGFFAVTSFGGGSGDGASNSGLTQARCVRQFDGLEVSDETANKVCGCMISEFDERGINVLEAFSGRADEMQEITRSCGQQHGFTVGG